jgi:glycerol uptake facilitator-like aquaporin
MDKNLRGYLLELLGTFAVVFLAAGTVCVNQAAVISGNSHIAPGLIGIALAYGIAYTVALAVVLPYSNGYLNPAITLMQWVFKRIDGGRTIALILVQLIGAAAAGGILRLTFSPAILTQAHLGTPHLNFEAFGEPGVTRGMMFMGAIIETVITLILTLVIYGSIVDPRFQRPAGQWGKRLIGLWVGLILVAITLAAFPFTGAAANPARWFGTVIWESSVPGLAALRPFADNGLPYWFGPIAGALLAGVVYNMLILPSESEHAESTTHHPHGSKASNSAALTGARK